MLHRGVWVFSGKISFEIFILMVVVRNPAMANHDSMILIADNIFLWRTRKFFSKFRGNDISSWVLGAWHLRLSEDIAYVKGKL